MFIHQLDIEEVVADGDIKSESEGISAVGIEQEPRT
jgi:hypothetical protein